MKLYLVRHGQTDWNAEGRLQGRTDIPLNQNGLAQARELAKQIQSDNLKFDAVYASPLERAYDTAKIITDGQYNIISSDLLMERSFGRIEGRTQLETGLSREELNLPVNCKRYNIETLEQVSARCERFITELKGAHPDSATILIVAHGGLLRQLHSVITNYNSKTDPSLVRFENCEMRGYNI